jgi:hypothetical protein
MSSWEDFRRRRSRISLVDHRCHALEISVSHVPGRECGAEGDAFENPAAFVVAEDEGLVALDRASQAGSELILAEGWFACAVEKILSASFSARSIENLWRNTCQLMRFVILARAAAGRM